MADSNDFNIENLTDEQVQQLMALGIIPDEQGQLQKQMDQAESIKTAAAPQGGYSRGGVYTAASPLEHIARVMQGIKAGKDLDKLYQKQQDLFQQQVSGRQSYFDAIRGRNRVGKGAHSYTIGQPQMQNVSLDPSLVNG